MEQRTYTFNQSILTVKFGNILESQAEIIASSDDCYVTMGGGVSLAILRAGGESVFISSENSNASINVIREIGYAVNMNKPILPLMLDDAPYAKSIRLDISDIDQIDFRNPMASSKKLITSLMYVLNK